MIGQLLNFMDLKSVKQTNYDKIRIIIVLIYFNNNTKKYFMKRVFL